MDYNEKTMKRVVCCPKCKAYIVSVLPANYRCVKCNSLMVTVVDSAVTGRTITGIKDEVDYKQFK